MPAPSLSDRVAGRVAGIPPRKSKNFFERLPPEHQAELLEVRRRFQSGELRTSAVVLADVLIEEATAAGITLCGHQGLRVWLANRD